ncbi:hypothetical protein [Echinicola sp. 20G]|uniref:hypothetical protein n=1 Tax=Echinicola sp. 20G TaxID=2781961 RepID=UPI0019111294|nr:hypothetical protein [Echinicola sp. 20G]
MKNFYIKLFPIILLLFVFSCGGEEDQSPSSTSNKIKLNASEVYPLQMITITTETPISASSIAGTLGGIPINLQRTGSNELIFMVPVDVNFGNQDISFTTEGIAFSSKINIIGAASIDNPESYVENYLSDYLGENAYYNDLDKSGLEKAKADFDQLTTEEKQQAAAFIQANSAQLTHLKTELEIYDDLTGNSNPNNRFMGDCNAACRFTQMKKVTIYTIGALAVVQSSAGAAVGIGVVGALDIGLSLITGEKSFLMNKVKTAVSDLLNMAYFAQNDLAESTFNYTDGAISNFRLNTDPLNFNNNEKVAFAIKINFRTLSEGDTNLSIPVIGEFINLYKQLITKFPSLGLPDFNTKTESRFVDDLESLSISISENNKVKVSDLTGNPEKFFVTFSTTEVEDQSFQFSLVYEDGFGNQVSSQFSGSINYLEPNDILIKNGPWELDWMAEPGSGDTYYESFTFKSDSTAIKYTNKNNHPNSFNYDYWGVTNQWENSSTPEGRYYLIMSQNSDFYIYGTITSLSKSKMIITKEGKEYVYLGKQ